MTRCCPPMVAGKCVGTLTGAETAKAGDFGIANGRAGCVGMAFTAADKTGDGTTIGVVLLANCPLIFAVNTLCPDAAAAFLAAAPAVREAGIGALANGDGVIPNAIIFAVAIIEDGTAAGIGIAFVKVDNGARCDTDEEVTDLAAPTPALFNSEEIILFVTADFDATDCDCGVAVNVDGDNPVMADLIDPGVAGGGGGMALASAAAAAAEDDVTLLVYSTPFFGIVI
mmetsp:Transcript_5588/g.9905  ORF Transcript_5588/g.9905 Transcript_5588/m.9905 type:complete len:227 (-) Transcript_5588:283-963(-)